METYLSELNGVQREAVEHLDGPVMIIAGAGSGKTRVLIYRVAHLMRHGVDPFNILSLTFTNRAANEMKSRIAQITGISETKNLWMGTFHSMFARILRFESDKLGYSSNFTIYDTQDSQRLISSIIKEMNLDKDLYKYKRVQSRISSFKNNLITVNVYRNNPELIEADEMSKRPRMGDIYDAYVERCFRAGAMDFDDLLLKTNELLTKFPEVLMKYQDRFRYIMVDEYQDTNHSQYLIVRALSDRFQNICVVGDDSQSIYAFRGANIGNILNFQKDFDKVKVFRLEQNYRSTKNIVQAANSVIEKNEKRLDKNIWTHNEDGSLIKVHRSITDAEEGRFIADSISENAMLHNIRNSNFAVLYRTNSQSRAIEDALRRRDIPYRIYGGLSFYQRKEIKDVLAYLRLIVNPKDEEALMRVINYPSRGIGNTTINKLNIAANTHQKSIFEIIENTETIKTLIASATLGRLSDFVDMIKSFQIIQTQKNAFEVTELVLKNTGLIQEFRKDNSLEGLSRVQNIEEMLNGVKDFVEKPREDMDTRGSLAEFLEDVALSTNEDRDVSKKDRVALMTIHLAKGLEFPYVYIVGVEENLFPLALSLNTKAELEEERRLFYVALTRAETQVYITYAENRYRWGKLTDTESSRFIDEIDKKHLEYRYPRNQNSGYKSRLGEYNHIDKSKLRQTKPIKGSPPNGPSEERLKKLRKLKPNIGRPIGNIESLKLDLKKGVRVQHEKFGFGTVCGIDGQGDDRKVEVEFDVKGLKKLILRFAKLKLMD